MVSKTLPAPGRPGSFSTLRGPQSWEGNNQEQWGMVGQRLQGEGRIDIAVLPRREPLNRPTCVQSV